MKGPLAKDSVYNYEDKIIIDKIRKKMNNMVQEAEDAGINVTTKFFGEEGQPTKEKGVKAAKNSNVPEEEYKGRWSYDPENNIINVPRTPTLLNAVVMAEELEHALNKIPFVNESARGPALSQRYLEEKRAKEAALNRVGGLLPYSKNIFDNTLKGYADSFREGVNVEQELYDEFKNVKNAQSENMFEDNYLDPEIVPIVNYWRQKPVGPKDFFSMLHPEVFKK